MKHRIIYILALLFATMQTFAQTYTYDDDNRLKEVKYNNGVKVVYDYDAVGNRTVKKVTGATAETFTITTKASPSGSGSVTGAGTYGNGTSVELQAIANAGYEFLKWSDDITDNPRGITVNKNQSFTAIFNELSSTPTLLGDLNNDGKVNNYDLYLLNEAYKPIFGFSALSSNQIDRYIHKYLRMVDKQLIPVILNDKGEVVGVAISMGSLSKPMQKAHGKLLPFGWYYLLKALKWHHEDNAEMLLIAIRPDYQGLGVNAMFFDDLIPIFNRFGFKWAETGPQLEDNVRELSQWKPLHPKFVKRRRCYKKKI